MLTARKITSTNYQNQRTLAHACVLNDTLSRISLRWKMSVLYAIAHGACSYGALKRAQPEITHQVLARRLRELRAEGLIVKRPLAERRSAYDVTTRGRTLLSIMSELCAWELQRS